jgi:hypothetical protein
MQGAKKIENQKLKLRTIILTMILEMFVQSKNSEIFRELMEYYFNNSFIITTKFT